MTMLARTLAAIVSLPVVLLTVAAMLTWFERRLLALVQDRYGPNRVGPFGLLQAFADGIKLLWKEDWVPPFADRFIFVFAPAVIVSAVLLAFAVMPYGARSCARYRV